MGDTLISVLRQLRAGYDERPGALPQSVILCGIRDVRDYRIRSASAGEIIAGGSAFNINAGSLRLGDFDEAAVSALLEQHTQETGQEFTGGAVAPVPVAPKIHGAFQSWSGRNHVRRRLLPPPTSTPPSTPCWP